MIEINVTKHLLSEGKTEGYVLICPAGKLTKEQQEFCAELRFPYEELFARVRFTGAPGSVVEFLASKNSKPVHLMFVGVGVPPIEPHEWMEGYRRGLGAAIRQAERLKITSLMCSFPTFVDFGISFFDGAKETAATLAMATYQFNQFITDEKRHVAEDYAIEIHAPESFHEEISCGLETGRRIGHAVNQARQWCDLPADILTPTGLAERAQAIADAHPSLKCTIFGPKEITESGMGGIKAVSQGSAQEPRLVVLEYTPDTTEDHDVIALVGKGVTFDSGGLSIKPASRMDEMKDDMAGAAAVISTMQAIAHLNPHVRVIGCTPLVENLPSGTAIKPGDIIYHYNGVTSEIKNTDAEGRLILADALAYVTDKFKPTVVIDIATLTGSCSAALGPVFAGCIARHEKLQKRLLEAAKRSGDRLWPLPMHEDYRVAIKSDIADICNQGSEAYRSGAITAGFFLEHFVSKEVPWVHLDIAGTSFNVPDRSYYRPGATGFGVRLFIDLLMNWHPMNP